MVSDPIGDFVNRLKNAGAVHKESVEVPYSIMKHKVADALVACGFLTSAKMQGKKVKKTLVVGLAYEHGRSMIRGVSRVSKPGRRMYAAVHEIIPVKFGKGKLILSTPEGILTGEDAKAKNVGGEQLFKIW
ncbi:MAG: ribosomal protein [Candidatus Parcubacteria bacterium]|jgi:small subunit ribosomal protein S8